MRHRVLILGGIVLSVAMVAIYFALRRPAPSQYESARPIIPVAPPAAQGPASAVSEAEVATAYHAWLAGDARAKTHFAELFHKLGKSVEPGLPEYAEIVATPNGTGVLVRSQAHEGGTLFADGATGRVIAWTNQGMRGMAADAYGPFLFEQRTEDQYAVFDGKAGKVLADVPGTPLAASKDGAVIVYAPSEEDDAGAFAIVRLWDAALGADRKTLRFSGTNPDYPAALGSGFGGGTQAVVSRDGRWVAALVEDAVSRLVVWDAASARVIAALTLDTTFRLAVEFAHDWKSVFALAAGPPSATGETTMGVVRVRLPEGTVEGPLLSCNMVFSLAGQESLAQSADGKLIAVGGADETCVFQASPLRFLWKTPTLRVSAGVDDDLMGTFPRFVLGDRALLVSTEGPPSLALFRLSDHAELARGALFTDPRDAPPVTHLVTDKRIVMMLEDAAGPILVDVDPTAAAKKRALTLDEREGKSQPPELAGAPPDGAEGNVPLIRTRESALL